MELAIFLVKGGEVMALDWKVISKHDDGSKVK